MKFLKFTFLVTGLCALSFLSEVMGQTTPNHSDSWASGPGAGQRNTSNGAANSFFGKEAGWHNTNGSYNSFFGSSAGASNKVSQKNSFFGRSAGWAHTTGDYNSFFGYLTGMRSTSGSYNCFFGSNSGYNTTADFNSFFGGLAGFSNTTGSVNVFLGINAGYKNTTGSRNTFIGDKAGYENLAGSENIYIGRYTGYNNKGGNNVFLGNYAGRNSTNETNRLRIANVASKTLIVGDFQNNKVGIGYHNIADVDATFAVNGTGAFGGSGWSIIKVGSQRDYFIGRGRNNDENRMTLHIPNKSVSQTNNQPTLEIISSGADRLFSVEAATGNTLVKGVVQAKGVRLDIGTFPDYVFADDYDLMPLEEVEAYIEENKHLPNMPSEAEVVENGMDVGQINTILVEKVEELTLHTIALKKELERMKKELKALSDKK